MISGSIATSESFNAMSEYARLTWCMILPHLDDYGVIEGGAVKIKALTQPLTSRCVADVADAVREMIEAEILTAYVVEKRVYLRAASFEHHQVNLHKRASPRVPLTGEVLTARQYAQTAVSRKFPDFPGTFRNLPELPGNNGKKTVSRNLPEVPGKSGEGTKELNELKELESKSFSASPIKKSAEDLVESFELDDKMRDFARRRGQDADALLPDWRDHWRANGYRTKQGPVKDAAATFRRWVRNANKFSSHPVGLPHVAPRFQP